MDRSRAIFSCALRRIKKESHLNQSEKDIPEKEGKNHHGIGRCFDARLDLPKAIAKGDDICALRHIKSDDKQGDQ